MNQKMQMGYQACSKCSLWTTYQQLRLWEEVQASTSSLRKLVTHTLQWTSYRYLEPCGRELQCLEPSDQYKKSPWSWLGQKRPFRHYGLCMSVSVCAWGHVCVYLVKTEGRSVLSLYSITKLHPRVHHWTPTMIQVPHTPTWILPKTQETESPSHQFPGREIFCRSRMGKQDSCELEACGKLGCSSLQDIISSPRWCSHLEPDGQLCNPIDTERKRKLWGTHGGWGGFQGEEFQWVRSCWHYDSFLEGAG